ncbi:hypothetical protein MKW98_021398 [Papaver atlanticum]|uniref:DUF4283 domain-containing protein n=1 Tax=Papaver atlanticum TaxID=357466 RepID=A0AAD4SRU3_9MAGN|nr:hypothetical protein MKW98_021398 [Papaver atlanticum]
MVTLNRAVDKEGFITATRRRTRSSEYVSHPTRGSKDLGGGGAKVQSREGKSIKAERKIIGGFKRRFCWLSFKDGLWLLRILKNEAKGGDGKMIKWNFRENEDWMLAIRKNNENGEFICFQVSHNKEYPSTLHFPAGINGDGWWDTWVLLEGLMYGNSKTNIRKEKEIVWVEADANACTSQDLDSLWRRTMVVEITSNDFDWKEVGVWIMDKFGWSFGFDLQPIADSKAVFTIQTNVEFSLISKIDKWHIEDTEIQLYPWFADINAIRGPNPKEINKVWVGVSGIPFNLWEYSTFKAIADKFGGFVEVFPETTMAKNLSEVRVKVNGPVSNGVWCEDLVLMHSKVWVEIRMIGNILETVKSELKPIFVDKNRLYQNKNLWRRRRVQGTGAGEEDKGEHGNFALVGSDKRSADHIPNQVVTETVVLAETVVARNPTTYTQVNLSIKS